MVPCDAGRSLDGRLTLVETLPGWRVVGVAGGDGGARRGAVASSSAAAAGASGGHGAGGGGDDAAKKAEREAAAKAFKEAKAAKVWCGLWWALHCVRVRRCAHRAWGPLPRRAVQPAEEEEDGGTQGV